jgi:methenyltetrahydromethanopterin cyclohydrolase
METGLNERAWRLISEIERDEAELKIAGRTLECGTRVFDFGVQALGGLEAGLRLTELCFAGRGRVSLTNGLLGESSWPTVCVWTDAPVAACLASQYAGWQLAFDNYFGMGSGPMRAAAGREELFADIGFVERAERCVGVIESSRLPTDDVCRQIAEKCGVPPERIALAVAPTASIAGNLQIVARSVETALHKLHELGWDVSQVHCGFGNAPLSPVAADDMTGIGRTNDAILYGAQVSLWITGPDDAIEEIGPRIPACASAAYGKPFLQIFEEAGRDFYKIDPMLFSPAEITIQNLDSGKVFRYGKLRPDVLMDSFELPASHNAEAMT